MTKLYIHGFDRSLVGEQVGGGREVERRTDRRAVPILRTNVDDIYHGLLAEML